MPKPPQVDSFSLEEQHLYFELISLLLLHHTFNTCPGKTPKLNHIQSLFSAISALKVNLNFKT